MRIKIFSDNEEPSNKKEKSSTLKALQRHIKRFDDFKTPSIRTQEQFDRMALPHRQISKIVEAQDNFRNWALPEQLERFRSQAQIASDTARVLQTNRYYTI